MQVARVSTRRGWVVIVSDATHFYADDRNNLVFPLVYDIGALLDRYRRIEATTSNEVAAGESKRAPFTNA